MGSENPVAGTECGSIQENDKKVENARNIPRMMERGHGERQMGDQIERAAHPDELMSIRLPEGATWTRHQVYTSK
jgi:hypothetical protein